MRIAIINRTRGGMSGGYWLYLRQILPRLAQHPAVSALFVASPPSLKLREQLELNVGCPVTFVDCEPFRVARHQPEKQLRAAIEAFHPSVLFLPVERFFSFPGIPTVTMIQNMGPLVHRTWKNPWSENLRYGVQRFEARYAARHADMVVAPTQFVSDFLATQWNIPSEKIALIHYGAVSPLQENQKPRCIPEEWRGQFLLTAGSIEPYRGLEDVVYAVPALVARGCISGLVIAGEARWNMRPYQQRLMRWAEQHGVSDRIVWAGFLREQELAWCYKQCRVFAMTSRVESFSMISLETLACGCCCVVAENPPLPEIFADTALYYTPGHTVELIEKVSEICNWSEEQRYDVRLGAEQRAEHFSWDTNVETLVSVFASLSARPASVL